MEQKSSALRAKEAFLALYQAGEFEPGGRIPSELQMAERLGVSRETWRKALGLLRSDGLLVSKHGSGTYLLERPRRIANDLAQLQSMSKMIAAAGIEEKDSQVTLPHAAARGRSAGVSTAPRGAGRRKTGYEGKDGEYHGTGQGIQMETCPRRLVRDGSVRGSRGAGRSQSAQAGRS